jgi:hypothetical protein
MLIIQDTGVSQTANLDLIDSLPNKRKTPKEFWLYFIKNW